MRKEQHGDGSLTKKDKEAMVNKLVRARGYFRIFTSFWFYLLLSVMLLTYPIKDVYTCISSPNFIDTSYWILDGFLMICTVFLWIFYLIKVRQIAKSFSTFFSMVESSASNDDNTTSTKRDDTAQ